MLTNDLKLPSNTSEQPQGWSIRRLLSLGGSVGKVVATFNPFEFVFFVMILISGFAELIGRDVSWFWYVLTVLVLLVVLWQRWRVEPGLLKVEPPKLQKNAK